MYGGIPKLRGLGHAPPGKFRNLRLLWWLLRPHTQIESYCILIYNYIILGNFQGGGMPGKRESEPKNVLKKFSPTSIGEKFHPTALIVAWHEHLMIYCTRSELALLAHSCTPCICI
jgi:hypothetical protein